MAEKPEIQNITSCLLAIVDWYNRTRRKYLQWARRNMFSTPNLSSNKELEFGGLANIGQAVRVDFRGDWIEFDRCIQGLDIGDRVRVLCDDGVLVAEKVSSTQFELIHAQATSPLIH